MKNFKITDIKPDEEVKVDFHIAVKKMLFKQWLKKYRKKVSQYFKKAIIKELD